MKNYLALAPRYLASHDKRTRLSILSIVLSVALVAGIFSMLDVFLQFEKIQVMHDHGNFHIAVSDAAEEEVQAISSRIDVQNAGMYREIGKAEVNRVSSELGALDEGFAENLNVIITEGSYPTGQNEIMVEQWACDSRYLNTDIGENVAITFQDGSTREFTVSGICEDWGVMKASGVPGVFLSMELAQSMTEEKGMLLVEFKDRVNIRKAEQEIMKSLNISEDRIGENNYLLAVIGQSDHKAAVGIYQTGAVLFLIVLIAGVVMIYNTFNISVMERVRQFGLLRCVGASRAQIRKLIKREGLILLARALPFGILLGIAATLFCCALLKFYNNYLFAEIPLFYLSPTGILAGIAVGFLTVMIASLMPAKKASRVSPVNAVTGSNDIRVPKAKKEGLLSRLFPAETAMGLNNAIMNKKTLILMSASIAISIIMFLGFNVFVDFLHTGLKTTKPYTPDISLTSEKGLDSRLYTQLSELDGVKYVYGRMFDYVEATFDASRLSTSYRQEMGGIVTKENGLFEPPEKSWLISYDEKQLQWAKADLLEGTLSLENLDEENGIIAVVRNVRKDSIMNTVNLQMGDRVYLETPSGTREYTVMGILNSVPFTDDQLNLATFITTEKQFNEIRGQGTHMGMDIIDIQLQGRNQEQTISAIKSMIADDTTFLDFRQKNREMNQTFLTMAVFVYGFVLVIALISILNIVSTMNTSVVSKRKYLGIMRAVGMSGKQLDKMIAVEAATYGITGCIAGCILGVLLQKALISNFLTASKVVWSFPLVQIICILILTLLTTRLAVIGPLKRVKSQGIAEVVGSL